jgi:hypothetical protein
MNSKAVAMTKGDPIPINMSGMSKKPEDRLRLGSAISWDMVNIHILVLSFLLVVIICPAKSMQSILATPMR